MRLGDYEPNPKKRNYDFINYSYGRSTPYKIITVAFTSIVLVSASGR